MNRLVLASLASVAVVSGTAAAAPVAKLTLVSAPTADGAKPAVMAQGAWTAPVYARIELSEPLRATVEALPPKAVRDLQVEWGLVSNLERGHTGAKGFLPLSDAMLDARVLEFAVCDPAHQVALNPEHETTPCWVFSSNDDLTRADLSKPTPMRVMVSLPGSTTKPVSATLTVSLAGYTLDEARAREKDAKKQSTAAQASTRPIPAWAISKERFKDKANATPALTQAIFGKDKTIEVLRFAPVNPGSDEWYVKRHEVTKVVISQHSPLIGTVYKNKAEGTCFVGVVQLVRYADANKKLGAPQRFHSGFTEHAQIACDRLK